MTAPVFGLRTFVQKKTGYKFPGVIIARFQTLEGHTRYVVECTAEGAEGCLHIFSGEQLERRYHAVDGI